MAEFAVHQRRHVICSNVSLYRKREDGYLSTASRQEHVATGSTEFIVLGRICCHRMLLFHDSRYYYGQESSISVICDIADARGTSGRQRVPPSTACPDDFEFGVPRLPEQRKIAAILSSVDDAIEKTQAVIDQVQVVKRGLMQELLTRGLPGRHTRFKQTEIGEIPEDWRVVRVGQIGAIEAGRQRSPWAKGERRPYLRVANVYDGYIAYDKFAVDGHGASSFPATSLHLGTCPAERRTKQRGTGGLAGVLNTRVPS